MMTGERGQTMDDLDRRLRLINLNLLPVLRTVLRRRNLTRAAEELNVTQSGVSNSLKQLRAHFGDELLVKDGRGMRLTDKGAQLVEPLERALAEISRVVANSPFDPPSSTRHFRVATADYVTAILAPEMAVVMSQEAPRMTLQMLTARGRSLQELQDGEIDLVISPRQIVEALTFDEPGMAREFALEPLSSEPFVCLARKDDEAFARGLTVEEYLSRPHASFQLDLDTHASLEHAYLIEHGAPQFNRILTSNFTILPLIVARSDCIALAPRSLAELMARNLPLQIGKAPLPVPDLHLVMVMLNRRKDEAELAWLRDLLRRCVAAWPGAATPTSGAQRPRG